MKRAISFVRTGVTMAALIAVAVAIGGCGNTFRPIASPIVQPGGDTGQLGNAIILSSAGTAAGAFGGTTHLDVSGDTVVSQHTVGVDPVAAVLAGGSVITVNQGDNTLSAYELFGGPGTNTTSINLNSSGTTFDCPIAAAHDANNVFVTMSGGGANTPCATTGQSGLVVVSAFSLIETGAIASNGTNFGLGTNPGALAELPNGNVVYIANKGSNTVSVMNTIDDTFTIPNVAVGASPDAVVASPDNQCVYVANFGSGTVSVINAGTNKIDETLTVGAGPSFMVFDPNLERVYVANNTGNSVTVIQHNVTNPGAPPSAVCSSKVIRTVNTGVSPSSVAPLANGSRFYVANQGSRSVSVFDAQSFTLRTTITGVQPNPVSIVAAGDSSRVYVASATQQSMPLPKNTQSSIAIINTANDALLAAETVPPQNSPSCLPTASKPCALQTPDFVLLTQ